MEFVAVGREMGAKKIVNLDGLFIADQRNDAEAGGLPCIVFLVIRLLNGGDKERGGGQGFLTIDLAVATGAGDPIGDSVRPGMDAAGAPQRLDAAIVANHLPYL